LPCQRLPAAGRRRRQKKTREQKLDQLIQRGGPVSVLATPASSHDSPLGVKVTVNQGVAPRKTLQQYKEWRRYDNGDGGYELLYRYNRVA
jgi:hypothetical protein